MLKPLCYSCERFCLRLWAACDTCDVDLCEAHQDTRRETERTCEREHTQPRILQVQGGGRSYRAPVGLLGDLGNEFVTPPIRIVGHTDLVSQFEHGNQFLGDIRSPNNWLYVVANEHELGPRGLIVVLIYQGEDWATYVTSNGPHDVLVLTTNSRQAQMDLGAAIKDSTFFESS